jgi:DNA-binding MarR family transcriptional regulator
MVEEAAGITRLLDKLEAAGYVIRERSTPDRRQVLCHITPTGASLITSLDGPMDAANQRAGANLDDEEREQLVELLGAVRAALTPPAQGSARNGQPPR